MYYSNQLFVKKGPLGNVWISGTIGYRKIPKKIIIGADIRKLCKTIKAPPGTGPLALPAQSTLLRGVVRIEYQQAVYLLHDANEAKGLLVFHQPSHIDLDKKHSQARYDQITYADVDPILAVDQDIWDLELLEEEVRSFDGTEVQLDLSAQVNRYKKAMSDSSESPASYQARLQDITLTDTGEDMTQEPSIIIDMFGEDEALGGISSDIAFPSGGDLTTEEFSAVEPGTPSEMFPTHDDIFESEPQLDRTSSAFLSEGSIKDDKSAASERKAKSKSRRKRKGRFDERTELSDALIKNNLRSTEGLFAKDQFVSLDTMEVPWKEQLRLPTSMAQDECAPQLLAIFRDVTKPQKAASRAKKAKVSESPEDFLVDEDLFAPDEYLEGEYDAGRMSDASMSLEMGREGRASDEDTKSTRSFLGVSLFDTSVDEESRGGRSRRSSVVAPYEDIPEYLEASLDDGASMGDITLMSGSAPDTTVALSQFEVPMEFMDEQSHLTSTPFKTQFNRLTAIFRGILNESFEEKERQRRLDSKQKGKRKAKLVLEFNSVLEGAIQRQISQGGQLSRISRGDAAQSFQQMLMLRTAGVLMTEQNVAYGKIELTKGENWDKSNSQLPV